MKGILTDNNNEIMFSGKDFLIGDIDGQTVEAIVTEHRGAFKEMPIMGFGATRVLGGNFNPNWKNEIKESLKKGLVTAKTVEFDNENISIEI